MTARLLATISEAGGDSPVRLPMNGIDCSWRINARGDASAEFQTADLFAAGLLDCEGYWFQFGKETDDLGPWCGIVQQVVHDLATATTEVAAQTNEALLDARRTAEEYEASDADAGGLAYKVIADNSWENSAFIQQEPRIGMTGLVDVSIRAEQVVDAIDQLAALAGAEWRVTWDRYFEFADRLGEDKTGSVVLLEGRDIGANSQVIRDVRPRVNDLLMMSGVDRYTRKTAVVVLDEESIEEIGPRQAAMVDPYMIKESLLRPAAKSELARLARLGKGATLEVLDTNGAWAQIREGDIVTLRLPSVDLWVNYRIMVRVYSSDSNTLTVSGEWVEV